MAQKYFCDFVQFRGVSNAAEVREACVAGKFRSETWTAAFLKSSLIVDVVQLKAAVSKAAAASAGGRMKTRSLDTEIVFFVSSSKSITDSLKQVNHFCLFCYRLKGGYS